MALGYGQVPGVDVFNTFAPVVKSITVRLLLALAFIFNMHVHQLDVSNAFCYAHIDSFLTTKIIQLVAIIMIM